MEDARLADPTGIPIPPEDPVVVEPAASTSRTFPVPFIGPVLPHRTPTPEAPFGEGALPSFEASVLDPIAIPRSDDTAFTGDTDDRHAPSPSSSLDVDRDSSDLVGGSESDGSPRFSGVGVTRSDISRMRSYERLYNGRLPSN